MTALPELVDAHQLAAALGPSFDERAVYRAHEHGLPRIVIGRRCVYDIAAVQAWFETCRVGDWPAEPTPLRRVV